MNRVGCRCVWVACSFFLLFDPPVRAEVRTWPAGVTGDWFQASAWVEGDFPAAGDDVVITGAGSVVWLTNSTEILGSLTLGQTLVFSNGNTALNATSVVIRAGGTATLPAPFASNEPLSGITFACTTLVVEAGGRIWADGLGYTGGLAIASSPAGDGHGPGAGFGSQYGMGASHGGRGGANLTYGPTYSYKGDRPYDSLTAPVEPGSGGGGSAGSGGLLNGGSGGGVIRIQADSLTVNGTISANGLPGSGGGSGGSVSITCRTIAGTGGVIAARGGSGYTYHNTGGHGGGGRIAVHYDPAAQVAIPDIQFLVQPGSMAGQYGSSLRGEPGTVWFPDNRLIGTTVTNINGRVYGFDALDLPSLTVNGTWVRFCADGFRLDVEGDLTVAGAGGMLQVGGGTLHPVPQVDPRYNGALDVWTYPSASSATAPVVRVGGHVVLTNGGALAVFAAATNGLGGPGDAGARVEATGDVTVASGSTVYPFSHPVNGGSVKLAARNVRVLRGGSVNAVGKGFGGGLGVTNGFGPGGALSYGYSPAGGYGGFGGASYSVNMGGQPYGSATDARLPGSGGGSYIGPGGAGGGLVWIEASEELLVSGSILCGGGSAPGGGGSGGGIDLTCATLAGSNGLVSAAGGNGGGPHLACGGGGRIAVRYDPELQTVTPAIDFRAGTGTYPLGHPGDLGTLWCSDGRFVGSFIGSNLSAQVVGLAGHVVTNLVVSNTWVRFGDEGFDLVVRGDLAVLGPTGRLEVGGPVLHRLFNPVHEPASGLTRFQLRSGEAVPPRVTVDGDLLLAGGGSLLVYSAPTNAPGSAGATVEAGRLLVRSNGFLYPQSHPTNGGSVFIRADSVTIDPGGAIDADGRGYSQGLWRNGFGPGAAHYYVYYPDGAGYGGRGGSNVYGGAGGDTYGWSNAPVDPGSGAGGTNGRAGGGLVWLKVDRTLTLNGAITASCTSNSSSGAGSGGGIFITCKTLAGSNGLLAARGGNAIYPHNGAGGGGRIAVWRQIDVSVGLAATAEQGSNITNSPEFRPWYVASPGTVVWGRLKGPGSVIVVR